MQNNDNQKTYFIYVRSTGEKVPVTKEQDHGRCMCPYRFIWRCDGDCLDCEYHAAGDITSLDQPLSDGNGTLGDYMPDRSKSMEEINQILAERRKNWKPREMKYKKGVLRLFSQHAASPMKGAYLEY